MTIYRSSVKNTEICEEYVLYTRNYVENVGGKSTITAKGGTTFGDKPETAKPLEITNLYVKVRLNDNYNGEFGFDWVDVDPETKQIEKIQGVPFSEVEYFYKKDPANPDLGDIVATSTDPIGAKHAIQDHYNFNPVSKHIDIPFALIKCDQEITLSAEIILWQGEIKDDVITITGDEFYEFEIIGGEKEGKTAKIKVTKAGKIDFKVKCLEEGSEKKYEFKHSNPVTGSHSVGGLTMMENNELKLKFRVIALVSSDGNPNEKAKGLFRKFKDNDIKKYLNENSLNQAGYEVEIENFDTMDSADVDDYFYAFDKTDWTKKELFKVDHVKTKKHILISYSPDGKEISTETETKEVKDVVSEGTIDYKTVDFYNEKLKLKSKSYKGGIIILSEYESPSETGAFSRTSPLNHSILFIYSNSVEKKEDYAHEIGHMLGLPHIFYNQKEKNAFKNAKESILGNGELEFIFQNSVKVKNPNYKSGINKDISDANNYNYYDMNIFNSDKNTLTKYLNNFINVYQVKLNTLNYSELSKKNIQKHILENKNALKIIENITDISYREYNLTCHFLTTDFILHLKRYKMYLTDIIEQIKSNYLTFKQGSTNNIMDYDNTKLYYLHNQIKTLRDDSKNYVSDILSTKTI
ncbi:hypothetical protein [Flavobacterium sp. LM4]|uniref:hypothetical protein n=1 Tax=Flavobacterium sp. LM4 TaxID=1938609 RepID=UPI0009932102|nr:hypothetical protein [Flavobacterium sp. LM4]OOV16913.1 hypothetical protein BXU10_18300 [Flavobacterium sp. LM4]